MGKYTAEGWLNFDYLIKMHQVFIFAVGARGIGKTYGAIKYCIENNLKFVFVRRSNVQLQFISSPVSHMLKPYLTEVGSWDRCSTEPLKDVGYVYKLDDEIIGIGTSLTMVSNVRGFDGTDFDVIIFDEFIPKKGERVLTDEGANIADLYETVNRNRELEGSKPVKLICLANSTSGNNPMFNYYNLVDVYARLQKKNKEVYINPERGCCIVRYDYSPISAKKKETALYKFAKGTAYYKMAIDNMAEDVTEFHQAVVNINEYQPIVKIGDIVIYKHKVLQRKFYVTKYLSGSCKEIAADEKGYIVFRHDYWTLKEHYVNNHIGFYDYSDECAFRLACGLKW